MPAPDDHGAADHGVAADGLAGPSGEPPEPFVDRVVDLRPVLARDTDMLYLWATDPLTAGTWRYRGATPSPGAFQQGLWDGVLAQYLVVRRQRPEPLGLVGLYNANMASGYAYAYALSAPTLLGTGVAVRGALALADAAFRAWPLRRLYLETSSRALVRFASAQRRLLVEAARLVDHERSPAGGYDDLVTLRLDRAAWFQYARSLRGPGRAPC